MRLYHAGLAILYYAWVCHSSVVAIRFDSKKTGCGQIMPDSATARVMEIASYLLAILSCDTVGKFVSSFVFFFCRLTSSHLILKVKVIRRMQRKKKNQNLSITMMHTNENELNSQGKKMIARNSDTIHKNQ